MESRTIRPLKVQILFILQLGFCLNKPFANETKTNENYPKKQQNNPSETIVYEVRELPKEEAGQKRSSQHLHGSTAESLAKYQPHAYYIDSPISNKMSMTR